MSYSIIYNGSVWDLLYSFFCMFGNEFHFFYSHQNFFCIMFVFSHLILKNLLRVLLEKAQRTVYLNSLLVRFHKAFKQWFVETWVRLRFDFVTFLLLQNFDDVLRLVYLLICIIVTSLSFLITKLNESAEVYWYKRTIALKNQLLHVCQHKNIQKSVLHFVFRWTEHSFCTLFYFFNDVALTCCPLF